jgi:hypothetical protein
MSLSWIIVTLRYRVIARRTRPSPILRVAAWAGGGARCYAVTELIGSAGGTTSGLSGSST